MKRFAVLLSSLVALTGCVAPNYVSAVDNLRFSAMSEVRGFSENLQKFVSAGASPEDVTEKAMQAVRDLLKDPESAKFRNVNIKTFEGKPIVCGEVNGKNSYGGYIGFTKFAASHEAAALYDSSSRYAHVNQAGNAGIDAAC